MFQRNFKIIFLSAILIVATSCQQISFDKRTVTPTSMRDVPALKLNFRFESDVPAPSVPAQNNTDERNAAIQADFDQNRAQEVVEKMIASPDKKRILAVYRKVEDQQAEYRLDMYSGDGKLLRKITPNGMAVHFPDTIVWSPAGTNVAFVGMTRSGQPNSIPETTAPTPPDIGLDTNTPSNNDANSNSNSNTNENTNANISTPTPEPPRSVLTFRTEQIYVCNSEGGDLKLLTQNEGLIYFYFVWSPDNSALATLAATWQEWRYGQSVANQKGEIFIPAGRPRLVEKTGRERLLDDKITQVQPVWSPDSAKIALGYDKEIRIYDAIGDAPTQAAIPIRNQLLISSKTFDDELKRKELSGNSNSNANVNINTNVNANSSANTAVNQDINTLPDENTLVSFNPVVQLEWTEDKMLYLQTGYIKEMKDAANSARSYLRWHRLLFSPQPVKIN
jgi:hypothetical protein